jgi:hypothetical protein
MTGAVLNELAPRRTKKGRRLAALFLNFKAD